MGIYSPLNLRSPRAGEMLSSKSDAKTAKNSSSLSSSSSQVDCVVAQGDLVSFRLSFKNPVSFDLHVNKLRVSTSEGFSTDSHDDDLVIPASTTTTTTLTTTSSSTPSTSGEGTNNDDSQSTGQTAAAAAGQFPAAAATGEGES